MGKQMNFQKLFEPGYIGRLKIKNRLVRAPMWTVFGAADGSVTDRLIGHYRELARGGVGLIIVEFSYMDRKSSPSNYCQLSVAGDEYLPGLARLAMTIKQNGAQAGLQISHAGGQRYVMNPPRKVPSRAPFQGMPGSAEELTLGEIEEIIEGFGDAAVRAKRACFDLVEVHACHGYLITEFLSARSNRRTDRYGGALSNRMRFLMEILQNIRKKIGPDFPLGVRLNGSEYLDGGITIEETLTTASALEQCGVNVLHVSGGTHASSDKLIVPSYWPLAYQVWAAAKVKNVVGIPVIASGSLTTPELAEQVLKEGKGDFVSLARPLLADPYFPQKAQQGRPEDIAPCIRCNYGCQGKPEVSVTCTVNAIAGREDESGVKRATTPRRVAVIGGGPAGMEAARVAAMMGHNVVLFEKRKLGGMLIEASIPEFKADIRPLTKYLSLQLEKLDVEIIHREADVDLIKKTGAEAVIVAAGATQTRQAVPGMDKAIAIDALAVLNGAKVGQEVLVVGGGLVGSETALFLAEQGKKVTLIEMLDLVLPEEAVISTRNAFFERLGKQRVVVETRTRLEEITDQGAVVTKSEGQRHEIKADTVVLAMGLKADDGLYHQIASLPDVDAYLIGDCLDPRKIYDAIHEGHFVARNLL